jgi:hypothetical protein
MGHDVWAILLVVDQLRKGEGYNGATRYFLIEGEHDYPPLFFYVLSLFPSSFLKKYNWAISPLLDSANAVILILTGVFLTGDVRIGAVAGVIYSFTPVVLEECLIFSMRLFGMVIFNCTMFSFAYYMFSKDPLFLLFTIAGGILVLLSHKFAAEVLFLLLLAFTFLEWSYIPILALLAVFLGAFIFSGGFYLKVLRGQVAINIAWLRHQREHYRFIKGGSYVEGEHAAEERLKTSTQPTTPEEARGASESFAVRLWRSTKDVNPLYWLLRLNPFNPFGLIAILPLFLGFQTRDLIVLFWAFLTLFFFYAATYLRFLGHYAGRTQYLDYNAFPAALVCSTFLLESFSYWKGIVISVAFVLALIQIGRAWNRARTLSRSDDQSLLVEIFDYLRKSPKDGVICLPPSHSYAIPYFTGKKVFYTLSARYQEKLSVFEYVLAVPISTLSREYGLNFVILDRKIVPVEAIDLSDFKPVMERNDYLLLEKSD